MNPKIAICVVGYNRLESIQRNLESLIRAYYPSGENVHLYISIDKSDSDIVASYADSFVWPNGEKTVIRHQENLGLRKHILSCGNLLEHYDALIVLEDDVVVSPDFYNYSMQCVEKYAEDDNIAGISLYSFRVNPFCRIPFIPMPVDSDIYLVQMAQSWGQVWMKNQWFEFKKWYECNQHDFQLQDNLPQSICLWPKSSWLKYHDKYCVEQRKFFVYPYIARSTCFSDAGVHIKESNTIHQVPIVYNKCDSLRLSPSVCYDIFMERIGLAEKFGIDENDLCVDYYGLKQNRDSRRYLLTRRRLPYKCLRQFGLQLRPYEWNIILGIKGSDLFLYDTSSINSKPKSHSSEASQLSYIYGVRYDRFSIIVFSTKKFLKKLLRR